MSKRIIMIIKTGRKKAYFCMIEIKELTTDEIADFWKEHIKYLIEDGLIKEQSEIEYYSGLNYHNTIESYMKEGINKLHMVWFIKDGVKIGATQYKINKSGDGECYILDFWVFPPYRGHNTGHECFKALEDYTKIDGAIYYKLDSEKENSIRFWKSLGFVECGYTPEGDILFVRR